MPMNGADSYRLRRNDVAMKNYGWYNKKASRNKSGVVNKTWGALVRPTLLQHLHLSASAG